MPYLLNRSIGKAALFLSTGLLAAQFSYAQVNCGPAVAGGTITCDSSTFLPDPTDTILDNVRYTNIDGLTLTATGITIDIVPETGNQQGIIIDSRNTHTGDFSQTWISLSVIPLELD